MFLDPIFSRVSTLRTALATYSTLRVALSYKLHSKLEQAVVGRPRLEQILISRKIRLHEKNSSRFATTCYRLGGIYGKAAQLAISRDDFMPDAFSKNLRIVVDDLKPSSFRSCRRLLKSELRGCGFLNIKDVFASLDDEPFAVGTVAQVHKAELIDGSKVAVKIQHPRVVREVKGDLRATRICSRIIGMLLPDLNSALCDGINRLESMLQHEVNFLRECMNSLQFSIAVERYENSFTGRVIRPLTDRIRYLLTGTPCVEIKVPKIYPDLASKRFLVMELVEEACRADEVLLQKKSSRRVADRFMGLVAHLLFSSRHIHCDMHLGNVLFSNPQSRGWMSIPTVRISIIDHGMYRRLDDKVSDALTLLTAAQALGQRELGRIIINYFFKVPEGLNGGAIFDIMEILFAEDERGDSGDFEELQESLGRLKMESLKKFIAELPADVFWFMRSATMARQIHRVLGGSIEDRMRIIGVAALTRCMALLSLNSLGLDHRDVREVVLQLLPSTNPQIGLYLANLEPSDIELNR